MKKERDLPVITSVDEIEHIRAITTNGESVLIKRGDLLPLATETTPGLLSTEEKERIKLHVYSSGSSPNRIIRLCGRDTGEFSGIIKLYYTRTENRIHNEYNIYISSYQTSVAKSIVNIIRVFGNQESPLYQDSTYLYISIPDTWWTASLQTSLRTRGKILKPSFVKDISLDDLVRVELS